jgi:hypothetical protein
LLVTITRTPATIRRIKSRRMRWERHVSRMGEKRNAYRLFVGNQREGGHWKDQDIGGWIMLGWIL